LESSQDRVVDEGGRMLRTGLVVSLTDAVKASSAIPVAFPPVVMAGPLGDENYVDGGVRENVPVREAVEAGAQRVFSILLNPPELEYVPGLLSGKAPPPIVRIAGRTADIALQEAQRNDTRQLLGFGVPVTEIAPTFLVHDTLMVEAGLIS